MPNLTPGDGAELSDVTDEAIAAEVGTPTIDDMLFIEATWLRRRIAPDHPGLWFWVCTRCECAFGPLTFREHAEQQAREHAAQDHQVTL